MTDMAQLYKKCKEISDKYELQIVLTKGPPAAPSSNLFQHDILIIDTLSNLPERVE